MEDVLVCLTLCVAMVTGVTVSTNYGDVIGQTYTMNNGAKVNYFYAIPYAKPPVGALRFKDPIAPDSWSAPVDATAPGPVCPQNVGEGSWFSVTTPSWDAVDEDCLHLDIYAPNNASNTPYPVMFFIHGDAFQWGATINYPGHSLTAKGVVVVVIAYRLGPLGFMSTNDEAATGNYGLKDQVLALKFVKENIEHFGGDPDKVTVFGQGSGGSSVGLLSVIPAAKGLFQHIIMESDTDLSVRAVIEKDQVNDTRNVAEKLGCSTNNTHEMMDCLRGKDWRNFTPQCKLGFECLGFGPVVDGTFLPDHPNSLRESGSFDPLPTMLGFNSDEGSINTAYVLLGRGENPETFSKDQFKTTLKNLVNFYSPRLMGKDDEIYNTIKIMYPPTDDPETNIKTLNEFYTDIYYAVTSYEMMKRLKAKGSDVYHYVFGYISPNSPQTPWMGVTRYLEVGFAIGAPEWKEHKNDPIVKDMKIVDPNNYTPEDLRYTDFMMTLWTNFAKYGNPTPSELTSPVENKKITWYPIDKHNNSDISYLFLGKEIENRMEYREDFIKFWTHCFKCLAPKMFETESGSYVIEMFEAESGSNVTNVTAPTATPPSDCDCPEEETAAAPSHHSASSLMFCSIALTLWTLCT